MSRDNSRDLITRQLRRPVVEVRFPAPAEVPKRQALFMQDRWSPIPQRHDDGVSPSGVDG
jgi:hypothetical protein